jgi:hypothetical protein
VGVKLSRLPEAQPPSWAYYAKKLALTFALVSVLGLLFYLVVIGVANAWVDAGVQYWLTLILTLPSIVLTCRHLIGGIREGEFPFRLSTVSRHHNPFGYLIAFTLTTLALLAMCFIVFHAIRALI